MKYDELEPVVLLENTIKAIKEEDINKLMELLEELNREVPIWLRELRPNEI
jgi:hypothetical protein